MNKSDKTRFFLCLITGTILFLGATYHIVKKIPVYYRWDLDQTDPQKGYDSLAAGIFFLAESFLIFWNSKKT